MTTEEFFKQINDNEIASQGERKAYAAWYWHQDLPTETNGLFEDEQADFFKTFEDAKIRMIAITCDSTSVLRTIACGLECGWMVAGVLEESNKSLFSDTKYNHKGILLEYKPWSSIERIERERQW